MKRIDLRSDTVAQPTQAMRAAGIKTTGLHDGEFCFVTSHDMTRAAVRAFAGEG